jgi:hypothetical protein
VNPDRNDQLINGLINDCISSSYTVGNPNAGLGFSGADCKTCYVNYLAITGQVNLVKCMDACETAEAPFTGMELLRQWQETTDAGDDDWEDKDEDKELIY